MWALLDALAAALGRGSDAAPLRAVEALAERVAALEPPRRRCLDAATRWQRTAGTSLRDVGTESGRRDLACLVRSLTCAVDIVASWPAGSQPRPERIALRHERCDLAELAADCCDAFRGLAAEREHHFRVVVPPRIPAVIDAEKVQLVILNLLFNAFKMTPAGRAIELVVEHQERFGEAIVRVSDSGAGIAAGNEQAIFDRHRCADWSGPVTADWLGFDLGASRDYVELHGGGLRLVPHPGRAGTELRGHLPLEPPRGTPVGGGAAPPGLPERVARVAAKELDIEARLGHHEPALDHRPLVLVIEDSRVMQQIVARALADRCNTASALDGRSGLRMAAELRPDLVVTDLGLPELDGAAVIRQIRTRRELDAVPILVVSARQDAAETVQLLREGVQDVMYKPFLVRELQARAHNLLEAKRARDMLADLLGEREDDLGRMAADVSRKQKRLEAALAELREAREHAEGANRVKSNFLRMMSHELKTPVTALILQQQILAREPIIAGGPSRVRRGFQSMSRSVTRLVHIVDTVLEWARVESGRFRPSLRPFALGGVVGAAAEEVRSQAENKGLILETEVDGDPPEIVSDARLVELIAINLLERAISVTPEGRVALEVSCAGRRHRVRVIDGGPPMSAGERRELFDALTASRDLHRTGGFGSGLGLHVVRDLARALGGDVTVADAGPGRTAVDLLLVSDPGGG